MSQPEPTLVKPGKKSTGFAENVIIVKGDFSRLPSMMGIVFADTLKSVSG